MPVRADLKGLYPPDWRAISERVRFGRAGGRCEVCDRPHGRVVRCLPDGRWHDVQAGCWRSGTGEEVEHPSGVDTRHVTTTRVVLACAHVDHDPTNNSEGNLAAWCSRCHLAHDAAHHRAQRRVGYRRRWAVADLFTGLYGLAGYPRNR